MQSSKRDATISAWQHEGEILTYKKIKQHLVSKKVIKETNDSSLSRWLKSLEREGILKKVERGYQLELKPKTYQVFDYINELRQKYSPYIWEGEVGGLISHVSASTYVNFDANLLQEDDEKEAFSTLSIRIAELFYALYDLRNTILKRRCGLRDLRLPDEVVREVFFSFMANSIGSHCATEELVKKYCKFIRNPMKSGFRKFFNRNKWIPDKKNMAYESLLDEIVLEEILPDVKGYKEHLKKEAFIDIDKYSEDELIEKFIRINQKIEENHERELVLAREKGEGGFMLTNEESELEGNYRMAILTKVAECIKAQKTDLEDFAIILTRHPSTMSRYYTPEHVLYNAMEWAKNPPEDEALKDLWLRTYKQEKSFEGMVAEHLATMSRFSVRQYENLRSKPWVIKELSKYGNFDVVIELYTQKLTLKKRKRHRL
jgi:hypothetical protein